MSNNSETHSDKVIDSHDGENVSESEYEEIDMTDNPLYQVLSAFFETENGDNLCDVLVDLKKSVDKNTAVVTKLLKTKQDG